MNLNFKPYLKHLPMAAEAVRYARAVAFRFALHETGALLCACAPLIYRAGESLQHFSDPPATRTAQPSSYQQRSAYQESSAYREPSSSFDDPSSFDF